MLAKVTRKQQKRHNTVIFVENSLFVSGVCSILKYHQMKVTKLSYEDIFSSDDMNAILICHVKHDDMEMKAQRVISRDNSTKLIIIKNNIELNEIERLIHMGVHGISLSDIDEGYLIYSINQVLKGHILIDSRFTNDVLKDYKTLKDMSHQIVPADDTPLKKLLTRRELEILHLLAKGYTNIQIGSELFISDKTVKNHVANLLNKLEVQDRLNAVIKAVKNNWIKID
ncbi:response regulator transcription factor [Gottfriedia solisilvae]|uniref:Transcriptional regulatory protein DegU n=1 Tax=Gottfriedia solisilvae TaxID=1516104 RepID=A0A8J3AW12_9BACI|nr:response regulator transcription factor [Gottfriedia solisilvae]GGI17897.1 transcriptional regulatory protein DegU [Gottfriedia solisilvae]